VRQYKLDSDGENHVLRSCSDNRLGVSTKVLVLTRIL